MLQRLDVVQVASHWNEIKEHLRVGLLPFVDSQANSLQTIFESLLAGMMEAWVLFSVDANDVHVYAMATTAFVHDPVALTKNLVLFSISGYENTPMLLWQEAKETLAAYAKEQKCTNVIAYSAIPGVVALAQREGANTDTRLLIWRV